jgi:hypothetical protein
MTMLRACCSERSNGGGRVPTNVVKITRKPPKPHRPAVRAIQPGLNEVMRARMLDEGSQREATC